MSDFIKLNLFAGRGKGEIILRISDIHSVEDDENYCYKPYSIVTLYNDKRFEVKESASEIFRMIGGTAVANE